MSASPALTGRHTPEWHLPSTSHPAQPLLGARKMSQTMKQLRLKAPTSPSPASLPLHFDAREQWPYCKDTMNEVCHAKRTARTGDRLG